MPQQEQQTQRQQSKKKRQSNIKNKKKRIPFIPNSPSSVGSPSIGALINQRRVRQLSPQHLCSLVLPPPLRSFFDTDGSVVPHGADDHPILLDHHARQSASNISISGASTSTHHNTRLPPHVRVGFAKCDPLLVFDGKYVLVATADGRIAIYSILEFDSDVSQDIKMSERRRRKEWADDDSLSLHQVTATPKEEKKFGPIGHECNLSNELEEEENEWEIRETMNKKEKARLIEPLLVVCLPNRIGSEGEQGNDSLLSPSTIVAICATPKKGISLVEQRNATYSTIPFPGDDFLGHVAVLTSVGDIHVLEFATSDTSKAISESNGADGGTYAADHPNVTIILSFDTESSGATSICMRPAGNQSGSLVRLCVGFESGLLHEFQLYATSFQRSSELEKPSTPRRQRSHEIKTSMRSDTSPLKRQTSDHGRQSIAGPSTVKVSLCWQGFIDTPIRSLSCTGWGGVGPQLLVVGTEYRQYANAKRDSGTPLLNHLSPAISLDMINASLAESMWRKMKYEGDTSNIKAKSKGIPLCDCSVWPAAGMEIKDGFIHSSTKMVPGAKHKPLSTIDLQRVSTTSKLCKSYRLRFQIFFTKTYRLLTSLFLTATYMQVALKNHNTALHLLHQMEQLLFRIVWKMERGELLTKTTRYCFAKSVLV